MITFHDVASVIAWVGFALGLIAFVFGLIKLSYLPLAVVYEVVERRNRRRRFLTKFHENPLVSVIVPAYNEGVVLRNSVTSVLSSSYRRLEVVIVDDGSTDNTWEVMTELAGRDSRVRILRQANSGKGAALNNGIRVSRGEVLMFVDADGVFLADTIKEMLLAMDHEQVGAVCGDDRPVNLDRPLTQMLALFSHAGCSVVRRALSFLRVLPIVSGNIGAFPKHVIEEVGGFNEHTLGEDLELTWRIHRAGYDVRFQPLAVVHAESPSTMRALWRQRVRWARGLLQTMRLQKDMIGNPRYGAFGWFLVFNAINMVAMPVILVVTLLCIPFGIAVGDMPFSLDVLSVIAWLGLGLSVATMVFAVAINHAWADLRFLWTIPLWPVFTTLIAGVMFEALWKEATGSASKWNKLARTGVVSDRSLQEAAGLRT